MFCLTNFDYLSLKENNWNNKSWSASGKSGLHKQISKFPCIICFLTEEWKITANLNHVFQFTLNFSLISVLILLNVMNFSSPFIKSLSHYQSSLKLCKILFFKFCMEGIFLLPTKLTEKMLWENLLVTFKTNLGSEDHMKLKPSVDVWGDLRVAL